MTSAAPARPGPARPRLARGARLAPDALSDDTVLLYPEGALFLNETARAVVDLCDGQRTVDDIVAALERTYEGVRAADVERVLARLAGARVLAG